MPETGIVFISIDYSFPTPHTYDRSLDKLLLHFGAIIKWNKGYRFPINQEVYAQITVDSWKDSK